MAITPSPQNIEQVFSSTNYFIDFYQRQYKWTKEPVDRLLDDIFYKFNQDYNKICEIDNSINAETIASRISSYFLNTYVTNTIDTNVYLVDGQQRFTTLTLLMIQLYQLSIKFDSNLQEWVKDRVYGTSGPNKNFWVHHTKNIKTLEGLLKNLNFSDIEREGITGSNMVKNSKIIKDYLDAQLTDLHKLETFIYYLLRKIEILRLEVSQQDVPMVFEVINDRGIRLKPHEILKGKLLGQVDKEELESLKLNDIWETQISKVGVANEEIDEIDKFFSFYIRSKVADTRASLEKYTEKNYHKALFEVEANAYFKLHRNPSEIKKFIQTDFIYFTDLYCEIRNSRDFFIEEYQHLYYNFLNDLTNIYILIFSSIHHKDLQKEDKLKNISYHLDRLSTLLQLQKANSNNLLTDLIYKISSEIRDGDLEIVAPVFNRYLLESLKEAKNAEVTEVFNYNYFKDVGYTDLNTRFNRYFLARIEYFICKNSGAELQNIFSNLVRNNGPTNGYHIEHILSNNTENLELFNNEETFERERNRLGGLLLLRNNSNQSSGNEIFEKKLKTYAQSLYWNATLNADTYHSNLDLKDFKERFNLEILPMEEFGPTQLEERHQLLSKMIRILWCSQD